MKPIPVTYPGGSYPIYLEAGMLHQIGRLLTQAGYKGRTVVVTNDTVGPLYGNVIQQSLQANGLETSVIELPDGEQYKTLNTVAGLYDQFVQAKLDRHSPVIALGGGVIGDMAGFAAASFLRGVPFVQIPTSKLAMVDASVGGKTGVDLPHGKNLVGAFKQPELVIIDPEVLKTLAPAELRAGLAETIKHGIIANPEIFEALEQGGDPETAFPDSLLPPAYSLTWLLSESVQVKVDIVQADPFEKGRRAVLNLGHTFGHAFEKLANFEMRHGDAIGIGMVCAARLAERLGHCSVETAERIINLIDKVQLPIELPDFEPEQMWATMFTDKKRQGNTIRFILPRAIGDVDIFTDITKEDVLAVLGK